MKYLLAMLSCGRPEYVERTLAAYREFLSPAPSEVYVYDDGGQTPPAAFEAWPGVPVTLKSHPERLGRCAAHGKLWEHAAASEHEWVFAVEDDILLLCPLDLNRLARLLEAEPTLQQVALVRCPWGSEIYHGGYIPMNPERYERRESFLAVSRPPGQRWLAAYGVGPTVQWIASTVDWTNSPALFRTRLPRMVGWPTEPGCESELGPRVLALRPDAVSGYWGWGEPWVAHIGLERVEGAHGY